MRTRVRFYAALVIAFVIGAVISGLASFVIARDTSSPPSWMLEATEGTWVRQNFAVPEEDDQLFVFTSPIIKVAEGKSVRTVCAVMGLRGSTQATVIDASSNKPLKVRNTVVRPITESWGKVSKKTDLFIDGM